MGSSSSVLVTSHPSQGSFLGGGSESNSKQTPTPPHSKSKPVTNAPPRGLYSTECDREAKASFRAAEDPTSNAVPASDVAIPPSIRNLFRVSLMSFLVGGMICDSRITVNPARRSLRPSRAKGPGFRPTRSRQCEAPRCGVRVARTRRSAKWNRCSIEETAV